MEGGTRNVRSRKGSDTREQGSEGRDQEAEGEGEGTGRTIKANTRKLRGDDETSNGDTSNGDTL